MPLQCFHDGHAKLGIASLAMTEITKRGHRSRRPRAPYWVSILNDRGSRGDGVGHGLRVIAVQPSPDTG